MEVVEDLRRLLYFFIDTILAEEDHPVPKSNTLVSLPVTSGA